MKRWLHNRLVDIKFILIAAIFLTIIGLIYYSRYQIYLEITKKKKNAKKKLKKP